MKVVQVHNQYRFWGGEDVVVQQTAELLARRGHRVIMLNRNSSNIASSPWGKLCAFAGGLYSRSAARDISRIICHQRPDVVQVHNLYPLLSPAVLVACRRAGVPVVMSCHNYRLTCPVGLHLTDGRVCERCLSGREYWCVLKNCRNDLFESAAYALRSVLARKSRLFLDNVTLFVALTEFARRRLADCGVAPERTVVLPNTVKVPDLETRRRDGSYVAYAGRISPEKGIETLLDAATLAALPVRVAGDWSSMPDLPGRAPENATFVGFLDKTGMDALYRKARFAVLPSKWFEVFPTTVVQAMSYGLPVIASRTGGIPEIVEEGRTGLLFEPGNARDLADKMRLLWQDPDRCRRMGKLGREKAIREYSEEVHYRRLMGVYRRAMAINQEQQDGQ